MVIFTHQSSGSGVFIKKEPFHAGAVLKTVCYQVKPRGPQQMYKVTSHWRPSEEVDRHSFHFEKMYISCTQQGNISTAIHINLKESCHLQMYSSSSGPSFLPQIVRNNVLKYFFCNASKAPAHKWIFLHGKIFLPFLIITYSVTKLANTTMSREFQKGLGDQIIP